MIVVSALTLVVAIFALRVTSSSMGERGRSFADDGSLMQLAVSKRDDPNAANDSRPSSRFARHAQITVAITSAIAIGISLGLALAVRRRLRAQAREIQQVTESAEEAATERDRVVELVSYGLRGPLSILTRGLSLLRDAGLRDEGARGQVEDMASATERIEALLDSAELGSGQIELHCEHCETRSIIATSLDMFFARAKQRNIRLRTDARGIMTIYVDRERVVQILANLLSNALMFSQPGDMITVSAWPEDGGVRFGVTDTGPGIPAEQHPHLFECSWQRDPEGRRDLRLGLYVCKRLVEAHRGRIGFHSELARGSTFWFVIPNEKEQRHF